MTMAEEYSEQLIQIAEHYDFIRFNYTDIYGISRSKTSSKSGFRKFLHGGIGAHVGSIGFGLRGGYDPGVEVCEKLEAAGYEPDSNVFVKAVSSIIPIPSNGGGKYKVGQVVCETFHALTGERQKELPRYIARQKLDELRSLGYSLLSSFEIEFVLVDSKSLVPVFDNPGDMLVSTITERFDPILMDIASYLESVGVGVETLQTENSQGQFELVLKPEIGIQSADNTILAKDCIKSIARSHGYIAIFMTKYNKTAEFSNSCHFNHSLKRGVFAFWDAKDQDKLSDIFRYWLGGLIHHFRALGSICCPTFNCYRRLHRGDLMISKGDWGLDDRLAAFRVKNYSPESSYIENRLPSGSSNPYLVMAATVAAGMDGLQKKMPCPKPRAKYHVSTKRTTDSPYHEMDVLKLPESLKEGMEAINNEFWSEALGVDFIKWFLLLKKDELKNLKDGDVNDEGENQYESERRLYMNLL